MSALGWMNGEAVMPHQEDIRLMAHLMRRASFGEPREELEERVSKGYEAVVEEVLYPERQPAIDDELLYRFFPGYEGAGAPPINQADWVFRMINTKQPLDEKMVLKNAPRGTRKRSFCARAC